jgi:hypothetical protein
MYGWAVYKSEDDTKIHSKVNIKFVNSIFRSVDYSQIMMVPVMFSISI